MVVKPKGKKPATKAAPTKPVVDIATRPMKPIAVVAAPMPPAAPAQRDELGAPRDVGRMLRYGERFGAHRIDVRMLPLQLPVGSSLAVCDPGVPKSWRVFDRPVGGGQFRVMLAIARSDDKEQLAAIVIHVGRPPIARWTVAHYQGQKKPKSPDALPRCPITTGWLALLDAGSGSPGVVAISAQPGLAPVEVPLTDGRRALALPCGDGDYAAYWAVDATDKPVCLVVDFDVFTLKDWKSKPAA